MAADDKMDTSGAGGAAAAATDTIKKPPTPTVEGACVMDGCVGWCWGFVCACGHTQRGPLSAPPGRLIGETDSPTTPPPYPPHHHTPTDLKKNVALLERAVQTTQQRLVGRVLRNNTAFRRALVPNALADALGQCLPADEPLREHGLRVLAEVIKKSQGKGEMDGWLVG